MAFLSEPLDTRQACADEIDDLLDEDLAEGQLQQRLRAWGSSYRAGDTDEDHRRWLAEVRDQIRAASH
jgi:hypothetical protein